MNVVETDFFRGSVGLSWTVFTERDCSAGTTGAILDIAHVGQGTITTQSSGWTRVGSITAQHGNLQGTIVDGTITTFTKDGPLGTSEEFIADNSFEGGSTNTYAASLKLLD